MDEDREFEEMKAKIDSFKDELKALMNKYNFGMHESQDYNGRDEYCGSNYYFKLEDEVWYWENLHEMINEIITRQ